MSPQQWTPPAADKQAWTPPAADKQAVTSAPAAKPRGQIFWETIGGQALQDLIGGASRDPARAQKAVDTFKGLVQGLADAPGRVWDSLARSGEAMTKGDIPGAAYHLAGAVPGLGTPAQEVSHDIEKGNYWDATERTAGMVVPFVADKIPGAVADIAEAAPRVAATAKGAVKGGYEAATESVKIPRYGVEVPGGNVIIGAGAGGYVAGQVGIPHQVGAVIGGAAPIVRGMVRGAREAMGPRVASWTGAPLNAWEGMPEAPPVPPSWTAPPVNAWEGMPEAAAPVAAAAETPGQLLARQTNTDWAKLSPTDQALLEQVAKAQQNVAAQPPRAPMGPPQAAAPVEVAPRGQTVAEMLAEEFAARKAARPAPVEAPPQVEAPPPSPARVRMSPEQLKAVEDDMAATPPAPGDPQPGRSSYYPNGELKSAGVRAGEIERYNRSAKAGNFSQALNADGVTAADAANWTGEQWKTFAEKNGSTWTKGDHSETIAETLFNLRKLEVPSELEMQLKASLDAVKARKQPGASTTPPEGESVPPVSKEEAGFNKRKARRVKGVEPSTPPSEVVDAPPAVKPEVSKRVAEIDAMLKELSDKTPPGSSSSSAAVDALMRERDRLTGESGYSAEGQAIVDRAKAAGAREYPQLPDPVLGDEHTIQELRKSIAEGEMLIRSGKKSDGTKFNPTELAAVKRSVVSSREKLIGHLETRLQTSAPDLGASNTPPVEAAAPPVSKEEAAFNARKAARKKKP